MSKFSTRVVLFLLLSLGLYAGDGLLQKHLVSVSPKALTTVTSSNTTIEILFDLSIISKSVKKNTIQINKIKGITTLIGDNTLRFTPNKDLLRGEYHVKVKKIKLNKKDADATEHKPKTGFQKFIYWLCSLFYDNPANCPMCKFFCIDKGDKPRYIKTEMISYDFSVDNEPKIVSVNLNIKEIRLHEGNETIFTVSASLEDNSSNDISTEIEWLTSTNGIVSISNGTIKALREGSTTIQAKYKNKISDAITFVVYKEINGYELPPEPDKILNDSTLLGIDSNSNGVRDDIERYIINKYNDEKIAVEIGFQYARAYNAVIENSVNALETMKVLDAAIDCDGYFSVHAERFGDPLIMQERVDSKKFESLILNTKERIKGYLEHDRALSGGVYTSLPAKERKNQCTFDAEQMLKDRK